VVHLGGGAGLSLKPDPGTLSDSLILGEDLQSDPPPERNLLGFVQVEQLTDAWRPEKVGGDT
jgi:hypothetical protein